MTAGEIFGFLGPNGAGKTTTIQMICSLLRPDRGAIYLNDQELLPNKRHLRKKLGVVPQEIALYDDLTALDNLTFWGGLYDLSGKSLRKRIDELLEVFGLSDRAKDPVKTYSGGMKRRLNMAAGMVHQPELLLLDEPTVGIDPQARYNMLDTVQQIVKNGTTILYTTHYLDEADKLCDRIAIMDHGKLLATGTNKELRNIVGENTLIQLTDSSNPALLQQIKSKYPTVGVENLQNKAVIFTLPPQVGEGEFIEVLIKTGFSMNSLQIKQPSLDSVFIKLTGRELRD